jgi:hypothetical protein
VSVSRAVLVIVTVKEIGTAVAAVAAAAKVEATAAVAVKPETSLVWLSSRYISTASE